MISCGDCKFYDSESLVCIYDCRVYAILNEERSAEDCKWYKEGKLNWDELEKTNYR